MKKVLGILMMLAICLGVFMFIAPNTVEAASNGTSGSCSWTIDDDGVMTIRPSNGTSGVLASNGTSTSDSNALRVPWYNNRESVTKVIVEPGVKTSAYCNYLFYGMTNCTEMDLRNLDISNSRSFYGWFTNCSKLVNIYGAADWDTSQIKSMQQMFLNCSSLLDASFVEDWDVSSCTSLGNMFASCTHLQGVLDLTGWDVSNVTNFGSLFSYCQVLEGVDLTGWDTSSATNMQYMFSHCKSLTTIPGVSDFDTSGVVTLRYMFEECNNLSELDITGWDTSSNRYITNMFLGCSSLTKLDLSNFVTDNVTLMSGAFKGCSGLSVIDVSGFETTGVTDMSSMFEGCSGVTYLDLSSFDTSSVTGSGSSGGLGKMFTGCSSLSRVNLGENYSFTNGIAYVNRRAELPTPPTNTQYTGKWIREDGTAGPYTPAELRTNYSSALAGVWVWETQPTTYNVSFIGDSDTTGSMLPVRPAFDEEFQLPKDKLVKVGFDFDHWNDGNGHTYIDEAVIPANTYSAGENVVLTAVFVQRDTSVTMEDGAFTFTLRDGERATFKDIPAGTSYQVYELTEDGWVLVQQENTAGIIEALEVSVAQFYNKYMPGITTVQFSGTKTLDGKAVQDAERFWFELWEGETLIESVGNSDGGFIQFSPIEYSDDDVGEHTYTIKEVLDGYDSEIEYDKHEETVTVTVELVDGKITNTVEYDTDGIKFENMTRPGSLKLSKYNNGISTDANEDDEFTFEITFRNESGMLVDDNIYWYIEGEAQVPTQEEPIESPQPED